MGSNRDKFRGRGQHGSRRGGAEGNGRRHARKQDRGNYPVSIPFSPPPSAPVSDGNQAHVGRHGSSQRDPSMALKVGLVVLGVIVTGVLAGWYFSKVLRKSESRAAMAQARSNQPVSSGELAGPAEKPPSVPPQTDKPNPQAEMKPDPVSALPVKPAPPAEMKPEPAPALPMKPAPPAEMKPEPAPVMPAKPAPEPEVKPTPPAKPTPQPEAKPDPPPPPPAKPVPQPEAKPDTPPVKPVPKPETPPAKLPLPMENPSIAAVAFETHIQTIFDNKCSQCHGDGEKKANLDMRTLKALLKGSENGAVLVAGSLEQSPLWETIETGKMPPPKKPKLTDDEKTLIRKWILAGAK